MQWNLGIDVQVSRGCAWAVLDQKCHMQESGWFEKSEDPAVVGAQLLVLLKELSRSGTGTIGIDAPRKPLVDLRTYKAGNGQWEMCDPAVGRHCELVIRKLKLAIPLWTPQQADARPWMRVGFELFQVATKYLGVKRVHEVFPSASYAQWARCRSPKVAVAFDHFLPGPKDMLDAVAAAATMAEYVAGRGTALGGGDQLGAIVVPGKIEVPEWMARWPKGETRR